jgi:excisionase family DNA binding protein
VSELQRVPDELVTREELAEIMRVSVPTIDRMKRAGMPAVTWGRRLVRFRVREAMAWAEQQHRAA